MSRFAVLIAILAAFVVAACSSGNNASTPSASGSATPKTTLTVAPTTLPSTEAGTPAPVPSGWTTFHGYQDCLTFSYPSDWAIGNKPGLTDTTAYCPNGAQVYPRVVECIPKNVINVTNVLKIAGPTAAGRKSASASMEIYAAPRRCPDLKGYFDGIVVDQQTIARNIAAATDAVISGLPARCTTMTFTVDAQDTISDVCAIDTGLTIYLIFRDSDSSRRDEFKPVLDSVIDSLRITTVATPTPRPPTPTPSATPSAS